MSDVQWLFVVLAVLYGWECLCWLRRGGVAFVSWLGRSWQLRHPGALAGNQSGGFVLAPPAPPLGTLFVTNQPPLSLSPDGVLAFVAANVNPGWRPAQSGRFVNWSDVREVRARGRKVMVQGELLVTTATPGLARHLSSELNRLAALESNDRPAAIVQVAQAAFDTKRIEARRAEWQQCSRAVRWLANLLVIYIFAVAPALVWSVGFAMCWLWLLLGLVGFTIATATLFARAHRALYPGAHDERFTHTLTIALAPTSAMRALDALSRPLLESFHPLAVGKVLLSDQTFKEFAGRTLRDLRHPALPLCPNELPAAQTTERFFRERLLGAVEEFLSRGGIKPEELCRAPARSEESSQAYCPRCEAQFTSIEGRCADCGGVELVAFTKSKG